MSNFQKIESVLQDYFDALYYCDLKKFSKVFHSDAVYATADEPSLLVRNMNEYFSVIEARESPASRKEQRKDYIESVELAGDNTAFARVRCSIANRDFVDFLTLVRTENSWKIIAKIFHFTEK
ncbi:MAG: nuclear transport factor 2 family protein [Kangiellaceae bacterium]|nr:nuclear transport factor 2 family protein [Kangiellaceae bacterium]MCW8997560.1 nuclear transport factor 2 family protein [Kangiellaceae bacterium]